jgi:hypothetical protein
MAAGALSCAALLQFLPLPDDVPDTILGLAASSMLQLLREEACVLTASEGYSKPSSGLLPDALLQLPDGDQLISSTWLKLGLPRCEYTHPDLLAGASSSSRARSTLEQLGARPFTAELLLQWLTAPGTQAHLTGGLQEATCSKWLQGLYACLHRLIAQPVECPLSLADAQKWDARLAAAPIVRLYGAVKPVAYDKASNGGRVFLCDAAFGNAEDVSLFSSNTGTGSSSSNSMGSPVLFVDPVFCTQQTKTESVLAHFFSLTEVPMDALVDVILAQQDSKQLSPSRHQQQLLFLVRNRQYLGNTAWGRLQASLQLHAAPAAAAAARTRAEAPEQYRVATELHFPCGMSGLVPAALQQDLQAVGVHFLHPDFEQLLVEGAKGVSASDVRSFLQALGVRELSAGDAITALLQLYKSADSLSSIRAEQHIRHVSFMASPAAAAAVPGLREDIRTSLRLYSEQQQPGSEGPSMTPEQLFLPLSSGSSCATSVMRQLRKKGTQFIHGCYLDSSSAAGGSQGASVTASNVMQFLSAVAGVKTGPDAVSA